MKTEVCVMVSYGSVKDKKQRLDHPDKFSEATVVHFGQVYEERTVSIF